MNRLTPLSIRFRLTAWYTAILAITFALVAVGVWLALRQSTRETIDKELRSRLAAVRAYVDREAPGERENDPREGDENHLLEELDEEVVLTSAATNLRIADTSGRWIYQSPGTERWATAAPNRASLPARGETRTIRVKGRALRMIAAPVKIGVVEIALPMDELEEVQQDFLWTTAVGAPILLVLAALAGFWMSGRALRPVDEIAAAAGRISVQNLSERLPGSGAGDELDRLSTVLNSMLNRLESAFRRVAQFTADASHELRTPTAIIRTTAEVTLARTRTVEEHREAWTGVQAQAERMSQLIGDLLLLARTDAGSEERAFEVLDLRQLAAQACRDMQVMAEAKGLSLRTRLDGECIVSGDAESLRRALLIVIDNAIQFTPASGEISVSLDIGNQGLAVLAVRDSGVGIQSDDLPRIFERFYRAGQDRSRRRGGAGLGLAIAQSILKQHGGGITVESKLGEGAVFRLLIPLTERSQSSDYPPGHDLSTSQADLRPPSPATYR